MTKVFPGIIAMLSISASIVYFVAGDYRLGTYWLAATILTISVTL